MRNNLLTGALLALSAVSALLPLNVSADVAGAHPDYVQAITDIRTAKALLGGKDTAAAQSDEVNALMEIEATLHDLTTAASLDGKNLAAPTIPNAGTTGNRFARAIELLGKAQLTISGKEDDVAVLQSRASAIKHLSVAIGFAKKAGGDDAAKQ